MDAYGGISLHERSHGESFLALALNRFEPGGSSILDEPEAALSPARQTALTARMNDMLVAHPQTRFIIANHSPILLAFPLAQIVSFDGGSLHQIAYHETDPYIITRRFSEHPDAMLKTLFEDEITGRGTRSAPRKCAFVKSEHERAKAVPLWPVADEWPRNRRAKHNTT